MAILNPDRLLDQAARLIAPPPAGPPRQVDVRRAISAAYYAVFHATLAAGADAFVGKTKRSTSEYSLVYRSVDHKALRGLCQEVRRPALSPKYARHVSGGFGQDIRAFAGAVLELYEQRHGADYDPAIRVKSSNALLAIDTAREALDRFARAREDERKILLTLLLFEPR